MVLRGRMTRAMVVKRLEAGLRGGIVSPAAQRQLEPRKILLGCPSNGQDRDAKNKRCRIINFLKILAMFLFKPFLTGHDIDYKNIILQLLQ